MKFRELKLSDQNLFEEYLDSDEYQLSAYHFCNIFIWEKLYRIFYIILDGNLCLFFKDKQGCFMYLPPLGIKLDLSVINNCFAIMDRFNVNKEVSRIENVQERNLSSYQSIGFTHFAKPGDYLCRKEDIVSMRGNRFKSKRASYNYFIKHYDFEFRPFLKQDKDDCIALYQHWAKQRKARFLDSVYQGMLEDSFSCFRVAMDNFDKLGLIGYIVKIKDKIAGYAFGFPINPKIFCILFEICDLKYRGISQFIFSQFCRELSDCQYINVMDDSGQENLRKVKLSYRPLHIVPNYIIKRTKN